MLALGAAPYVCTTAGVLMPSTKVLSLDDDLVFPAYSRIASGGRLLTFQEIIEETFKAYAADIVANIDKNNELLRRLT